MEIDAFFYNYFVSLPTKSYDYAGKQNLRGSILETAMHAFAKKGIRAVKMDDVAAALGISKRTLYEIFETKELLLSEGIRKYYAERQEYAKRVTQQCKNVMEVLVAIYRIKVDEFRKTNPQFYADMDNIASRSMSSARPIPSSMPIWISIRRWRDSSTSRTNRRTKTC